MADEIIIEEIVINSIIETVDKIAGKVVAGRDKIARIEAVLDKIAGDEAINDNTIDPFVELVVLAADRVGEGLTRISLKKLSSIQVLRRLLIILSIHISNWLY